MSDEDDYDSETTTNANVSLDATTEFWSSENDYDVAQIMTKRVTFTVYMWLFRVMIMLGLMAVLTFVICVPITITLLILNNNIRRVIVRKRKYWENDEYLLAEVIKKVDKKIKKMEKEKQKRSLDAMKEAKRSYDELKALMQMGGMRKKPKKRRPPPPGRRGGRKRRMIGRKRGRGR